MTTSEKWNQVENLVVCKFDQIEADKAWTLLNSGVSVERIVVMLDGGTLIKTPHGLIPVGW